MIHFDPQWLWMILPVVFGFGQSSGPAPSVVPIPPPTSLFPGATSAIAGNAPGAINTATQTATGAASGLDVGKIYDSIVQASGQQRKEGAAAIQSSMGASGMAASSDNMRAQAEYQEQFSSNLLQQLQTMQFQSEALKLGGSAQLMDTYGNAGMTFAPTSAVVGQQGGPSIYSQLSSAAAGSAGAIASLWPILFCWIGAELYGGWGTPEVFYLRKRITTMPRFRWAYVKWGQQVAEHIKSHRAARRLVKFCFDQLLASAWREQCRKQV